MAYSIQSIRNNNNTSIYGRRLGLDFEDFLGGPKGLKKAITDVTTVSATVPNYGIVNVLASGSSVTMQHTVETPKPGIGMTLFLQSTSTGGQQFKFNGGAVVLGASLTTVGSTMIQLLKQNAQVSLMALSSVAWMIMGNRSSLASSDGLGYSFTTST